MLSFELSGKELKKFYKNVTISQGENGYEVNLDKRKLKTPLGNLLRLPTEPLALLVAAEWDNQHDVIKRHAMHMTSLCCTSIDNPTGRSRDTVIQGILEFLDTDTICYRVEEPPELAQLLSKEWDPLLRWVQHRYNVSLEATTGLGVPMIPPETKAVFQQHLESFNDWALVGYQQGVDCTKSLIITSALVERLMDVERAIQLSRLEQEYQVSQWGNVEWYHDIDVLELRARLAAATLFIHLNSTDQRTTFNKDQSKNPV